MPGRLQRRTLRNRRRDRLETSASNDQRSALWTVLLIGLIFCFLDVAYLLESLERQEHPSTRRQQSMVQLPTNKEFQPKADKVTTFLSNEERERLEEEKHRILVILEEAGVVDVDDTTLQDLPTWQQVVQLYGEKPRIYGLEQCEQFRKHSDESDHFVSIAGTFNTGTNLMAELLINNCPMPKRMTKYRAVQQGIQWQVPWGRHTPPRYKDSRLTHKTSQEVNATGILPVVVIRDPYVWMQCMCRRRCTARWLTSKDHCPNLVPTRKDLERFPELKGKNSIEVTVKYDGFFKYHESLAHFWSDWYNEYIHVDFPRLIVRFEDILFHAREVTETVCNRAGGEMNQVNFRYIMDSAKGVDGATQSAYAKALITYGTDQHRYDGYSPQDLAFAERHVDANLADFFGYRHAPKDLLPQ